MICISQQGAFAIAIISSFLIISNLILKAFKTALLQPFVVFNILTISFLILLSIFFISAIYDSHSYAAEYVELAISDRMQRIASIISIPQENGTYLNFSYLS
uniref:Bm3193 n=1 Tax=Brugia malayi TaxID=6279 RepID=A0A0J9Y8P4_BRUMA|nr:Bm3193 [Brugia malayi]